MTSTAMKLYEILTTWAVNAMCNDGMSRAEKSEKITALQKYADDIFAKKEESQAVSQLNRLLTAISNAKPNQSQQLFEECLKDVEKPIADELRAKFCPTAQPMVSKGKINGIRRKKLRPHSVVHNVALKRSNWALKIANSIAIPQSDFDSEIVQKICLRDLLLKYAIQYRDEKKAQDKVNEIVTELKHIGTLAEDGRINAYRHFLQSNGLIEFAESLKGIANIRTTYSVIPPHKDKVAKKYADIFTEIDEIKKNEMTTATYVNMVLQDVNELIAESRDQLSWWQLCQLTDARGKLIEIKTQLLAQEEYAKLQTKQPEIQYRWDGATLLPPESV